MRSSEVSTKRVVMWTLCQRMIAGRKFRVARRSSPRAHWQTQSLSQSIREHVPVARRRAQAEPLALRRVPKLDTVPLGVDAVMARRARGSAHVEGLLAQIVHRDGRPGAGLCVHQMRLPQHARIPVCEAHHARRALLLPSGTGDDEGARVEPSGDRSHGALFFSACVDARKTICLPGLFGVLLIADSEQRYAVPHVALHRSRIAFLVNDDIVRTDW